MATDQSFREARGLDSTPQKPWSHYVPYCPFCPGESVLQQWDNFRTKQTGFFMQCKTCNATGPEKLSGIEAQEAWGHVVKNCTLLAVSSHEIDRR